MEIAAFVACDHVEECARFVLRFELCSKASILARQDAKRFKRTNRSDNLLIFSNDRRMVDVAFASEVGQCLSTSFTLAVADVKSAVISQIFNAYC